MRKTEAVNTFNDGLVMDTNPLVASNKGLCNALNATLITMNGNENVLLNDMGNGRVETAYLPEGYVPIGTTEFGGIIYIVSYNPLIDKCLIGSFPSPERNITEDELEDQVSDKLTNSDFIIEENGEPIVKSVIVKKKITGMTIHPGDKFLVSSVNLKDNIDCISNLNNPINFRNLNLKIATIDSNGRIVYLNDLLKHTILDSKGKPNEYYIKNYSINSSETSDLDAYRKLIGSNYNIFSSKISGELYVVAELETIESFSVEWKIKNPSPTETNKEVKYIIDFTPKVIKKANNRDISYVKYKDDYYNWLTDKTISVKITNSDANGSKTFEFIPCMNYGRLDYLKSSVTIDFSLFGTDTILSKDWRYFLEENQMIISYSLESYLNPGKEIESITLYFIQQDKVNAQLKNSIETDPDKILYKSFNRKIETRKSYSGNYLDKISFNNQFIKNELYLVVFVIKVTNDSSPRFIYHCLYTNGVFNNEYINSNSKSFDEININLLYDLKLKENKNISFNLEINTEPSFINSSKLDHIRGCTLTNLNGEINIISTVELINNYNTFNVDLKLVNVSIKSINSKLTCSSNLINTGNYNVDSEYVKITQQTSLNPEKNNEELGDWVIVKNIHNSNKITVSGQFYNKISSDSILKKAQVLNYYKPLALMDVDYSKYGLYYEDNTFKMSNTIIGLGMSTGGRDNQGGGGLMHVYGLTNLSTKLNSQTNKNELIQTNTEVPPSFGGAGEYGISTFPDSNFSNYLDKYYSGNVFAPILLVNTGNCLIYYDKSGGDFSFKNEMIFTEYGEDRGKHDNARVGWFKEELQSPFKVIWLFMRSNNNTQTSYLPFNLFYKFTDLNYSSSSKSPDIISRPFSEYISALVSQLYIKSYNPELYVNKYGVNDISYFNNITENIDIDTILNINSSSNNTIKFNITPLSKINDNFSIFFNNGLLKCFEITGLDYTSEYLYKSNITFTLNNLLLEKYLLYQSLTLILDSFVENRINGTTLLPPDNSYENLYQIDFNSHKLIPINDNFIAKKIKSSTNLNGIIRVTLDNENLFDKLLAKSMFAYDNRNNMLLFKQSKYNSSPLIKARWEGHYTNHENNYTYFKDIKLIPNKHLGSLNDQ